MARRGDGRGDAQDRERAVYVISVAAELAGVHPQTLRIYERKKLLQPKRTSGNSRRYSERDVERLRKIQQLTQDEGVNLAGVRMVLELENQLQEMAAQLRAVRRRMTEAEKEMKRSRRGELVRLSDVQNIFRKALK